MKKIVNIIFAVLAAGIFYSCELNEIDTASLTDFSPGIASVSPADGGKVVQGNFDIVVAFADGNSSPLASVDLTLLDSAENELHTASSALSGTRDTLVVSGTDFGASSLSVGAYFIHLVVADSKGQVTDVTTTFDISKLPFAANNDEMYIAGGFNGWGWDSLVLVSDHVWELKEIELDGGEFKLKNTKDWTDQDWGDSDCDGVMEVTTGGGPNTNCGYSGLVNIRFNDQTLQYSIEPAVNLEQNISALYLLGSFNDFQGEEYAFTLTENNAWVLEEVVLKPGDSFKFSEGPFGGRSFGDFEGDGVAEESAPNIRVPDDHQEGVYSVTFNDATLEYALTFVRNLFPDNLYLVGDATSAGWDPEAALEFTQVAEGQFEIVADLVVGEFKFLQARAWDGDWGMGATAGTLEQETESNIAIDAAGSYKIVVDFTAGTYTISSAVPSELFLVGGSTVAGWTPADAVPFTKLEEGVFRLYSYLTVEGEGFKFLEVRDWAGDWGVGTSEGTLEQDTESNVTVPADGFYRIDVNFNDGTFSVAESNWGVIGSATPGGWDNDTDMSLVSETKGNYTWTVDITLTDGEIKFRENDAWDVNYGDTGADGTLDAGGDNIVVSAGSYTMELVLDPENGYTYSLK